MNLYEKLTTERKQQINDNLKGCQEIRKKLIEELKNEDFMTNLSVLWASTLIDTINKFKPFSLLEYYNLFNEKELIKKSILNAISRANTYGGHSDEYNNEIMLKIKDSVYYIDLQHTVTVEEESTRFDVEKFEVFENETAIDVSHFTEFELNEVLKH